MAMKDQVAGGNERGRVWGGCPLPSRSGVHLAECSKVVVLELPYSTEFGRESRKFAAPGGV